MSASDEGGDPACWLDRVCPECGAVLEDDAAHDHDGAGREDGGARRT